MTDRTEADAVAQIATQAAAKTMPFMDLELRLGAGVILPPGSTFHVADLERFLPEPRRVRGNVTLVDAASFATYFTKHRTDKASTMYADVTTQRIVAVLNDAADADSPGWRDHVAVLALTATPEWKRWAKHDGQLLEQVAFAEHIEDSTPEIVSPDAATMLEVAQSFHAKTNVTFDTSKRLHDGQQQLTYHEETTANAGAKGELEVPTEIVLQIAPFEVGDDYELIARLRFRLQGGHLLIGYKLTRPEDVLRQAFAEVVQHVENATSEKVLYGMPPNAPQTSGI